MAAGYVQQGDLDMALSALLEGAAGNNAGHYGQIIGAALGQPDVTLPAEEMAWAETLKAEPALLTDYAVTVALQIAELNDAAWAYYQEHLSSRPPHIALAQVAYRSLGNTDNIAEPGARAREVADALAGDARAWLGLAAVYRSLGDSAGESEAIRKALEVGPKMPEVLFRHAALMEREGNIDAAVAGYRNLVEVAPESGAANNNLAYTLLLLGGKDDEALKYAQVAFEKIPRDAGVMHTLGLAEFRTGNLESAEGHLGRAAEMDPANPTIMFDYARLLVELGNAEEAGKRVRYALAMARNAGIEFPQEAEAQVLNDTLN